MRRVKILLGLVAATALAGCGGGTKSGGGASSGQENVSAAAIGDCLNDENWLAVPSETSIEGSTESGTVFALKIYATDAAAKAAGHGANQDVIGRVVVSYQKPATGTEVYGQPGKKDPAATATIKSCIDKTSG